VPERVVSVIEGESLINDGASFVIYRVAVVAVATGAFTVGGTLGNLLLVGGGGALLGLAVAIVIAQVRRRVEDATIEITVTLRRRAGETRR